MNYFTKESLERKLRDIRALGWVETQRSGNDGGVGNTLEDLLGIEENNLPLPNTGEWELKGQREDTNSLLTLFHMEPSPRAMRFVPRVLLPLYGWSHREAGDRYPANEMSFRQTITAGFRTNRGFTVLINRNAERVEVSFNHNSVDLAEHRDWLNLVEERVGLSEIDPQPYWGFDDLFHKAGTKLNKTLYAIAERKRTNQTEFFRYSRFLFLEGFRRDKFIDAIERGDVLIDFDARTGHNHGTKFRLRQNEYPTLYESVRELEFTEPPSDNVFAGLSALAESREAQASDDDHAHPNSPRQLHLNSTQI